MSVAGKVITMQQERTKPETLLECDKHDLKVATLGSCSSKVQRAMKLRLALHESRKMANSSDVHLWDT